MATYNWAFRPGIKNKYNLVIPNTADDVKPDFCTYIALWGNDELGNGSRMKPFKTYTRAIELGLMGYLILGAGVYREEPINNVQQYQFIGDGDVVIDITYRDLFCRQQSPAGIYNITFRGTGISWHMVYNWSNGPIVDCVFDGVTLGDRGGAYGAEIRNCIFKNIFLFLKVDELLDFRNTSTNCTFYNCTNMGVSPNGATDYRSCVFVKCNIASSKAGFEKIRWSLFDRCNFKLDGAGNGGAVYPSVPAGYTYYDNIETLRADCLALYGSPVLFGCSIASANFNNEEIGDFSLSFESLAKNMSYFGTYVGSYSIGYGIKARANEAEGDFDFESIVNLNVEDNSITMIDSGMLATINSKVKSNIIARELSQAPIFGFYADRNGQYIDSIPDLSNVVITSNFSLSEATPYIVEDAAITYNGSVIQPGERFTTNSVTSFTTANNGVCREIVEAPQRHTIMARFFDGGDIKIVGDALTSGYWYYVKGTINYNGTNLTDVVFKAVDGNSFTGEGVLQEAMTDQEWQHYEPGVKFTSNNVGDVRTGAILRGNGDPNYERSQGKEFPINSRFLQVKYMLQPNNLKP